MVEDRQHRTGHQPRPKFYIAAQNTPESFAFAGRMGHSVMAIPLTGAMMRELLGTYRTAWKEAGHPGEGEVMLAFHMFCDADGARARAVAGPLLDAYLRSLVEAAGDWLDGRPSADYPGYDRMINKLRQSTAADQIASGAAWIGSPAEIIAAIERSREEFGGFEHASLQVFTAKPGESIVLVGTFPVASDNTLRIEFYNSSTKTTARVSEVPARRAMRVDLPPNIKAGEWRLALRSLDDNVLVWLPITMRVEPGAGER